jgi:excisionase family DNA binding protein
MDYLTTEQASEALSATRQRDLALIREGRLPARKVGRDWLIAPEDLDAFEKRPQGNYKPTPDQVKQIKYMAKDGTTPMELAKKFKVSVRTIYRHMNN